MSIGELNIRTRIELETRVLAAALKQSFERGDSDGVSLAHRQLFLLLKDQKPGNGSSAAPANAVQSNGDTSIHHEELAEETEEQPAYSQAALAEPEVSESMQSAQPTAEMHDYQQDVDAESQSYPDQVYAEVAEVHEVGESEVVEEHEPTLEPAAQYVEEWHEPILEPVAQYVEEPQSELREIPEFQHQPEIEYLEATAQEIEDPASPPDPEQEHAIAQYLKYKKTRDQPPSDDPLATSDNITLPGWHQVEGQDQAAEPIEAGLASGAEKPLTEEEEYVRMRKAPPVPKESVPFDQPSAEYAEIFGSAIVEPAAVPPGIAFQQSTPLQTSNQEPGPFDSLLEPPSFAHEPSRSPIPPSAPSELEAKKSNDTGEFAPAFEARNREIEFDSLEAEEDETAAVISEPAIEATIEPAIEPVTEPVVDAVAPLADLVAVPVAELEAEPVVEPIVETPQAVETFEPAQPEQVRQIETYKAPEEIAPPPSFHGQFYAPENTGVRNLASGFATPPTPPRDSDLPPELRQVPSQDYSHMVPPSAPTNEAQPEDATRPESPLPQRTMPAIDFSLQSESQKPDIDFSLQSESKGPNIDFTLQSESQKPNIDFSLQSESVSRPNIDFSLESENQNQAADGSLNAPTGGGFIEAEFVTNDTDLTPEEQLQQDITSELPILNPAASLYLSAEESAPPAVHPAAAAQTAPSMPVAETPQQPAVPLKQSTVPFTGIPMMVVPNHVAPPTVPIQRLAPPPPPTPPSAETTSQEEPLVPAAPKPPDLYALLGVSQMSPFEEIHKNFLRKIRKILLRLRGAVRPERDELLKELRRNWVARDILCDPVTRTDYDFRDMGLRGSPDGTAPHAPEDGPQRMGQRTPLRIGELLQCAGLLEMAELEIACDMHKAMPEVQFGTFLVRQGFIQERDLESVLLGQNLLRDGKITVAQFQVAMELSQSRGANISDTLIEHGYITAAELELLTEKAAEANDPQVSDTPKIKEVAVKPRQLEPAAPTNLNASSAVPTWKDQLDWSKPLPVDNDDSLMDRNPEKQSLAELLGNVNTEPPPEPEKVKISNNAAPSWKDQLDWEQPKEESQAQNLATVQDSQPYTDEQSEADDEDEYDDDQPLGRVSKETQPISIHPPTSVAPNITLGKGGSNTVSDTSAGTDTDDKYLQNILQSTDIFEQPIDTGLSEADKTDESAEESEDENDPDQPTEEREGFFKKSLGKLRKSDPKDKKKKRK